MKCLSLFANVGIGEAYFDELDVEVVVANELLADRAEFYRQLYPETNMICGDISKVYGEILTACSEHEIELIIATPPCQGMSIANAKRAEKEDPRNSLIKHVVRAIKELNPKYALVENVSGMKSEKTFIVDDNGDSTNIMPFLERELGEDYNVSYKVLDAADYETPHHRKRLITLITRKDCNTWRHPEPVGERITTRQVIGHLPSLESGQESDIKWHSMGHKIHNDNHISWIRHTPTGKTAFENRVNYPQIVDKDTGLVRPIKGFSTTYKRIEWDKPAPTVTMMNGSINSQNNCHPGRKLLDGTYSDARVLTIKELLAIIGMPEDWVDHLEHTKKRENFLRKVLGECFPPHMSKNIIKEIKNG